MSKKGIWFEKVMSPTRGVEVILVHYYDKFIATICPPPPGREDAATITIVSAHLQNLPGKLHLYVRDNDLPVLYLDFKPFVEDQAGSQTTLGNPG